MTRTTTDPNDITFRQCYLDEVLAHRVTTIFRPGKRLCGDSKGYCKGQMVTVRVVEKVGADWANVPGLLRDDVAEKAEIIEDPVCMLLGSLTDADFVGSTPDIHDQQSLKYHLGVVYNLAPDQIDEKTRVTRTTYRYL